MVRAAEVEIEVFEAEVVRFVRARKLPTIADLDEALERLVPKDLREEVRDRAIDILLAQSIQRLVEPQAQVRPITSARSASHRFETVVRPTPSGGQMIIGSVVHNPRAIKGKDAAIPVHDR